MGHRRQDLAEGFGGYYLSYQTTSKGSVRVSDLALCSPLESAIPYSVSEANDRLHGTWLPPSAFTSQRSHPTPIQPLLQDKLARSRISHFVSIIFSRPATRDKSLFERVVLGVMWPAALLVLGVAITEAYRHLSASGSREPAKEIWNVRSGVEGYEDLHGTMERVGWGWGFTIGLEVVAVALITIGWYLWPGQSEGEGENEHEREKED